MSNPSADDLALAAEFPAATRTQWLQLVERVLKGAPFETLAVKTADGLAIEPLYPRAPEAAPITAHRLRWQVMARVDHPDPVAARAQALDELDGGANGLVLVGADSVSAHGYGLPPAMDTIAQALDGVHLDAGIAIEFDLGAQTMLLPLAFAALVGQRAIAPETVDVRFGFDPLGNALVRGGCEVSWAMFDQYAGRLAGEFAALGFRRSLMAADGRVVHGAGGTQAQELAYVIATAVAYLRALEGAGIALDEARRMICFRLVADSDQFLTIAKFRALRKLWARIETSCGLTPEPAFIGAETAWRTMTRNDPYMNILRATIAVFAAGIGGADAITVLPFTAARGLPDAFARRIARNIQLILLDEANVARVADPAAGAGGSEQLTGQLCKAAWTLFQEIETAGGAPAAIAQGLIQDKVAAARAAQERAVATRDIALVGANEFPELDETPVAVLDVARTRLTAMPAATTVVPLAQMRLAEPYEALRDISDQMLATTGARPRIFLANLGDAADFSTRANFAQNFFAAGGIEAVTSDGFASRKDMIATYKTSGATRACLCGSDAVYAREAADTAKALKAAGARRLFLVGEPGEREAQYRQAGIETLIHAGCDALAILRAIVDR
jgi:methylmalonyl-CoA mutase